MQRVATKMSSDNHNATRIPINAAMRAAFKANASAALRRRSNSYLIGMAMNVVQWLVIASVALLGLYRWGWTAAHMLIVFVAGIAVAAIADLLKYLLARRSMLDDFQKMKDDRLVWHMVTALQQGLTDIEAPPPTRLGAAIAFDLVLGAIGVWLLWSQLQTLGVPPAALLASGPGLRGALIAVCIAPLCSLLSSLVSGQKEESGHDELEFRAGGRGISLIFLAAALWFLGGNPEAAHGVMIFINGATVFFGVLGVFGVWLMYREREWLRAHLQAPASSKRK